MQKINRGHKMKVMGGYWNKNKRKLLPWVKDFTDPQDHIRNATNVRKLKYDEWFYCHTSSYKLFHYGINIIMLFALIGLGFIMAMKGKYIFTIITSIIMLVIGIDLMKKIWNYQNIKNTTLYDLYMLEDKEKEK